MGTVQNELVIVHHWDLEKLKMLRNNAIKEFQKVTQILSPEYNMNDMISSIMTSYKNNEYTFIINGDCSKIDWDTAERFHSVRMRWCEKHKYDVQNIIVINFGEDGPCRILFDSSAESEEI